jgi:hypothetical protein
VLRFPGKSDRERTQPVRQSSERSGETTQVLKFPGRSGFEGNGAPGPGDRTRSRNLRRATGDVGGDETQVIRLSGPSIDEERTQVIRPGLVPPPGERTEVLQFRAPARATDDEDEGPTVAVPLAATAATAAEQGPTAAIRSDEKPSAGDDADEGPTLEVRSGSKDSIAGAERPDFAEDPTSRIIAPGTDGDEEPTENGRSEMTVMNMERPPDDVVEEPTTPLAIPAQRRPDEHS